MERITNIQGTLLEGCLWDARKERIYFVDIDKYRIYRYEVSKKTLTFIQMNTYVSCVVLDQRGFLIAALQDGLYRVNPENGNFFRIMESGLPSDIRYNDGKCDKMGALWLGSMVIPGEHLQGQRGNLFCIKDEQIVNVYGDYTIPNGLAWDKRRNLFYHVETADKSISIYKEEAPFSLGEKIGQLELAGEDGSPDGMCIDREGNLFVAMWGAGAVLKVNTRSEKIEKRLLLPDKNVSCCTFGGREMNQLYITTAKDEGGHGGELYVCELSERGEEVDRYGDK